jgi:hypothetical protein
MRHLIVLFLLLVPCSSFVFSAASHEQPTVSPGSSEWNELFDPPFTKPTEIPVSSPLRKSLFAQLRTLIEKKARQPVRFEGSLKKLICDGPEGSYPLNSRDGKKRRKLPASSSSSGLAFGSMPGYRMKNGEDLWQDVRQGLQG